MGHRWAAKLANVVRVIAAAVVTVAAGANAISALRTDAVQVPVAQLIPTTLEAL